jgi:hypothetical protein
VYAVAALPSPEAAALLLPALSSATRAKAYVPDERGANARLPAPAFVDIPLSCQNAPFLLYHSSTRFSPLPESDAPA